MTKKLFAILAATATAIVAPALPKITWLSTHHNFGAIAEDDGEVHCSFKGVNTGDDTVVIYSVKPNCGCTTTRNYTAREYEPGDTITIEVDFSPESRMGVFNKKIAVRTNTDPQKTDLTIAGNVIPSLRLLESRYPVDLGGVRLHAVLSAMGEISKGGTGAAYVRGYNATDATVHPQILSKPRYMNAIVEPAVVAPHQSFVIALTYQTARSPKWGLANDTVIFSPDTLSVITHPLEAVITIKESFKKLTPEERENAPKIRFVPDTLHFGTIDGGQTAENTVRIENIGLSPLKIHRVYTTDRELVLPSIDGAVIAPGETLEVQVGIDPNKAEGGVMDATLRIVTNAPDAAIATLRVTAEPQNR